MIQYLGVLLRLLKIIFRTKRYLRTCVGNYNDFIEFRLKMAMDKRPDTYNISTVPVHLCSSLCLMAFLLHLILFKRSPLTPDFINTRTKLNVRLLRLAIM